jgi:sec-independent protein translocase protein TatB
MLGIGFFEIVIIALVAFIVIGPKELPVLMRKFAGFYHQFISLRDELRFQLLSADTEFEETKKNPSVVTEDKAQSETIARAQENSHG